MSVIYDVCDFLFSTVQGAYVLLILSLILFDIIFRHFT